MPAQPPPSAEFLALTEKYLAGDIAPGELARWEAMCLADPAALAYYLSLARVEAFTPGALARLETREAAPRRPMLRFVRSPAFAAMAACLALAALGGAYAVFSGKAAERVAGVPAHVTNAYGLRWISGGAGLGERPAQASAAFSAGLLELTMDSGVRLLIQGPASYTVTGPNSLRLDSGRAVADVPLPARGFTLTSPRDRIVDHGTRFAVEVKPDGAETTLGVLSGEVEYIKPGTDVRLHTDYAVRREGDRLLSVPFDKSRFTTEAPSREFPWNLDGATFDARRRLAFDVTPLVHGPGDFRVVVRWLLGLDAIFFDSMRLECDGRTVATAGSGHAGHVYRTAHNAPVFRIAPGDWRPGRWTLVIDAYCAGENIPHPHPAASAGVVSFEEGLSVSATAASFVGRWHYSHNGDNYEREFLPDGTARLYRNGKSDWKGEARWSVKDGVCTVDLSRNAAPAETHMLRDNRTLIFLNRPYRNAVRVP